MSRLTNLIKSSKQFTHWYTGLIYNTKTRKPATRSELAKVGNVSTTAITKAFPKVDGHYAMPVSEMKGLHNYKHYFILWTQHLGSSEKGTQVIKESFRYSCLIYPDGTEHVMTTEECLIFGSFFGLLQSMTEADYLRLFPYKAHKTAKRSYKQYQVQSLDIFTSLSNGDNAMQSKLNRMYEVIEQCTDCRDVELEGTELVIGSDCADCHIQQQLHDIFKDCSSTRSYDESWIDIHDDWSESWIGSN